MANVRLWTITSILFLLLHSPAFSLPLSAVPTGRFKLNKSATWIWLKIPCCPFFISWTIKNNITSCKTRYYDIMCFLCVAWNHFRGGWIGSGGPAELTPGSLDLIPCDFVFSCLGGKKSILEKTKGGLINWRKKKFKYICLSSSLFLKKKNIESDRSRLQMGVSKNGAMLTLQRGVTSTARHSVNITCRGVTSPARHAARSHSFVYISTS